MSNIRDILEQSMTDLEHAAYFDLGKQNPDDTAPDFLDESFQQFSKRMARGPYCKVTSDALLPYVARLLGRIIRREEHEDVFPDHCFLSISALGDTVLSACDLIIDPTYLQFANPKLVEETDRPNIFIGTRHEIFELMHTQEFNSYDTVPEFYLVSTLIDLTLEIPD